MTRSRKRCARARWTLESAVEFAKNATSGVAYAGQVVPDPTRVALAKRRLVAWAACRAFPVN